MKTGNNNATNNFIIRVWSKAHYKIEDKKYQIDYSGSITEVKSKQEIKFHSAGQLLKAMETLNKKIEIMRRKNYENSKAKRGKK